MQQMTLPRVDVKELKLRYCNKETVLVTRYPYHGNLVSFKFLHSNPFPYKALQAAAQKARRECETSLGAEPGGC